MRCFDKGIRLLASAGDGYHLRFSSAEPKQAHLAGMFDGSERPWNGKDPGFRRGLCGPAGARTPDPLIKSQLLYQLSYKTISYPINEGSGESGYKIKASERECGWWPENSRSSVPVRSSPKCLNDKDPSFR